MGDVEELIGRLRRAAIAFEHEYRDEWVSPEDELNEAADALTTLQARLAAVEAERVRLSEALTVIAERPGTGTDRWGNGLSENEHMAEIAQDTLEGNEHFTVEYYKENRWEQPHG